MLGGKKKILIIAESINVEDSSGSKTNVNLIKNFRDAGYQVKVYHYSRKQIEFNGIECINIKEKKIGVNYFLSRFQRKVQHLTGLNWAKYLEPIFGFSFTFFNDTQSILNSLSREKESDYDLVITLSKGASFRPHYAVLNLPKFHSKWMAYIHDPYPFHLYPEPYKWSEPGYLKKISFFKEMGENCKWLAYPSLLLKEWMETCYETFKNKGIIIPHQLRVSNQLKELPDYFDPSKFNLVHAGNLMKQRPPFSLIKGFTEFLSTNPKAKEDARLLLIGNATYHSQKIKDVASKIPELYYSDGVEEFSKVLKIQEESSINIILESEAVASPFLPGKFPHCMAADKPVMVLGPKKSEVMRLLGENYPYWSECNDNHKIANLIGELYQNWKSNPQKLTYCRMDIKFYLSTAFLKEEIDKILI